MRNTARVTLLLAMAAAPLAAQGVARDELPIRTWNQEMRDKAETSLYEKHDCKDALLQANAAYDRAMRHPARMDPRIPLVKARAHDCLGQLPAAIAAYGLHDQLAGLNVATDPGFIGACQQLNNHEPPPADSAALVARQQELIAHAHAIRATIDRGAAQAGRSPGHENLLYSPEAYRAMWDQFDGTRMTETQLSAMWPRFVAAWSDMPPRNAQGYITSETARTQYAIGMFEVELAETQARLLCLQGQS